MVLLLPGLTGADGREPKGKAPGPGDVPPPVLGKTLAGDEIVTTQFAGKVLVVTFWATWCPPCRAELPILEGVQKAAKGNVQVVAVNIEAGEVFRKAARALKSLTLTLANDPYKSAHDDYGVNGIPHPTRTNPRCFAPTEKISPGKIPTPCSSSRE